MAFFVQDAYNRFILSTVPGFFPEKRKLASGIESCSYYNFRTVAEDVCLADQLAEFILQYTRTMNLSPDTFIGVAEGATKIALITQYKHATRSTSYQPGSHVLAMQRGKSKEHGDQKDQHFLGVPKGKTIVIEDVTTTGSSLISAIKKLREAGVDILAAYSLLNRMEKRGDGKSVEEVMAELSVPFHSLTDAFQILPRAYQLQRPGRAVALATEEEYRQHGVRPMVLEERIIET